MKHKISFCTVCMNRLHHLKQTLPQNIKNNLSYGKLEFIVMDYSSSDGLSKWIMSEMSEYIENGILVYYRYDEADYFDRSHSRNLMFKLASGDIICNTDADNYLGKGFAEYIAQRFEEQENFFLVPDTKRKYYYLRDALGRFCASKEDFMAVSGYDERMSGYGFEDDDLYDRLINNGKQEVIIMDLNYLHAIKHGNENRVENEFYTNYFHKIYINYETHEKSNVLVLYKNGTAHKGILSPNTSTPAPAVLANNQWESAQWKKEGDKIVVKSKETEAEYPYAEQDDCLNHNNSIYYNITNEQFLAKLSYDLPLITNYGHFLSNKEKRAGVNKNGFGKGTVYKNFSTVKTIVS
ncbi:glycosyltransferase family 2 protein [Sporocytophaga myxococcoides]|uniref:glycosyltransferase family 2 protein n=1 Tax=Sporocytophaga myxococcoides TaxID=153721 RepID=UPI00138AF4DD|nr:glycosyltransferase family A protein [Sporocytophaga myxococcoides]